MVLKFFTDHCISNFIVKSLRQAGHKVFRLQDSITPDSPDAFVIAKAQELNAILVSLNGDFADIVTYPPEKYAGIFSLQLKNHPELIPQILSRLHAFLSTHPESEFYRGKLFLIEVHRIRIRA
ncbi:MAG: DUF5615 family PIN-like protein [Desulfohalobiaceae bacterium]|nr:DUF5615 family PIN-like protein [Desulfohalobiaceae bacterium]